VRRNLSIIACVEGTNWGWQHGEIWVDNGCRADFLVFPRREERREEERHYDRGGATVVCESPEGRYRRCDARIPAGVRINRQFGRADCVRGRNWDYDRNGIWVDHGCKAEFFIEGERVEEHHHERTRVVCESRDAHQVFCSADTRFGVEMARQLSTSECVFRRSWGYNDRGIWVRDGCRAEFFLGH
jgi:hypothetical protein